MTYYYALWIPQTKAGIPVVLTESQDTRTLKDDPDDDVPEINLRGYIEKSSLHIHIAYSCGKEPERELLFKLLDATEQGFLIYQLNIEKEDSDYLRNILHEDEDRQTILNEYHDIQKAIGTQKKQFDKQQERLSNNQDSILKLLNKPTPKK